MLSAGDSQQPVILQHLVLSVDHILPVHQHVTHLTLSGCISYKWDKIGLALASLSKLRTLVLISCKTDESLYKELRYSKSLLQLYIGTRVRNAEKCGVTEEGVQFITSLEQLEELKISSPRSYSEEQTEEYPGGAFKRILKKLRNLRVLEIVQPSTKKINLGS